MKQLRKFLLKDYCKATREQLCAEAQFGLVEDQNTSGVGSCSWRLHAAAKITSHFGALVVGLYQDGVLHYVAHTGGGFNQKTLEQVYKLMQPLRTEKSPFVETPKTNEPVQWIKPKLVAQVKFSEWTADRRMRHPIFLGLRTDKKPLECTFETKKSTNQVVRRASKTRKA